MHPRWGSIAFGMRCVSHISHHIVNFELIVYREADIQTMNRLTCRLGALARNDEGVGFDIRESGFNVPQAIFPFKA